MENGLQSCDPFVQVSKCEAGFELNIFKMGSWNHVGRTENMIIKDFIRQMYVPSENSAYFGDGDGVNSTPGEVSSGSDICQELFSVVSQVTRQIGPL